MQKNKNMTRLFYTLICCCTLFLSCEKSENELTGVVLYNPFEPGNGVELMQIDSTQKVPGASPDLKAFFSINYQYFSDTAAIDRVMLFRDGEQAATLSPGNYSFFVDNTVLIGETYEYQLSILMDDGSITKKTMPFEILFQ